MRALLVAFAALPALARAAPPLRIGLSGLAGLGHFTLPSAHRAEGAEQQLSPFLGTSVQVGGLGETLGAHLDLRATAGWAIRGLLAMAAAGLLVDVRAGTLLAAIGPTLGAWCYAELLGGRRGRSIGAAARIGRRRIGAVDEQGRQHAETVFAELRVDVSPASWNDDGHTYVLVGLALGVGYDTF